MAEKTEQPTEKKKRDSRKKGQSLQSKELTMFSAIISIVVYLALNARDYMLQLLNIYSAIFQQKTLSLEPTSLIVLANGILIKLLFPPIIFAALISMFVNIIQMGGVVIAAEAMSWKLDKFNIVNNAKNIFGKKNLIKFLKSNLEVIVMIILGVVIVKGFASSIFQTANVKLSLGILLLFKIITTTVAVLLLLYFIFALFEYLIEMLHLKKELMMTLEEVKNEYKSSEGSPEIKHARKEFHQSLSEEDNVGRGDATMVLANPTHVAVMIAYSPKKYITPIICYKAQGIAAQVVFKFARKNKTPIIHSPWLARQLFEIAVVGQPVPASLRKYLVKVLKENIHLFPQIVKELQEITRKTSIKEGSVI